MQPNKWGLYDMLGNVWEWTQDFYNEKMFADLKSPRSGKEHVLKGGVFTSDVKNSTPTWHGDWTRKRVRRRLPDRARGALPD